MARLLALLIAGAGAVLLLWALLAAWQAPPTPDLYEMEIGAARAQATLTAIARHQVEEQASAARWSAFWDVVLPLAGVLVLAAGAGLLVAGGWALWGRRRPLVTLDALALPVDREALHRGAYVQLPYAILEHQTQAAIAAGPQQPHTLTYSPHYANRQDVQGAVPGAQLAPPVAVPTFADLLSRGQIGAGQPLLLGYGADGPLTGALKDWRSGAVAGLPGAGKTTTQRFIAAQAALAGARLVVLDPHGGASNAEETLSTTLAPLAAAFLCEPACEPAAMLQALHLVHEEMERRLHGGAAPFPIFAFVDEGTALLGHHTIGPELARLLESITLQGRKTLIQCVIGGQGFNADRVPTTLRDNLASTYVHRMKRNQARALLPSSEAAKVETLPTGAAVLWRADGSLADVVIPLTTGADMEAVGRRLTTEARPTVGEVMAKPRLTVVHPDWWTDLAGPGTNVADLATAAAPALTPMQKRALALWRARRPPAEIVAALGYTYTPTTGPNKGKAIPVTSAAGAVYQAKLTEVLELIWSAEEAERRAQPTMEGQEI